ncbi:MAG: hypothetical protein HC881_19350 [Leptolyngbyaceae cyanobacterium SL_7_1]|nr:hypothetical protein [Leptolyngbyaceae cyanobacterium SL_7_1]
MPRKTRSSRVIAKAEQRAINLKMINPTLQLNSDRTLESYVQSIDQLRERLATYNSLLAQIDLAQTELLEREKALKRLSEDMLIDVASKYGKDSYEYQMAGGTRRSDRKRPVRKARSIADDPEMP